jgi:hypothetical protein
MNTLVDIRSNAYTSDVDPKKITVTPLLELVLIYSNGKEYIDTGREIVSKDSYADLRLIFSPKQLDGMISTLQEWRKTLTNREEFWKEMLPGVEPKTEEKP